MCVIVGYKTKQDPMTNSQHQISFLQNIVLVLKLDNSINITEIFYVVSYCRIVYFNTFTD